MLPLHKLLRTGPAELTHGRHGLTSLGKVAYEYDVQLRVDRIKCTNPGTQCQQHEWRATFEVVVLDGNRNCTNVLQSSEWLVEFYAVKSARLPADWGKPYSHNGCTNLKGLLSIDGECYPQIQPLAWWVRARVRNTLLNYDIILVGHCTFGYPETYVGYDCTIDYQYGVAEYQMDRVVIGTRGWL